MLEKELPKEGQDAVNAYTEALKDQGDLDPEPFVSRVPTELQQEVRGLCNTALMTKRALKSGLG